MNRFPSSSDRRGHPRRLPLQVSQSRQPARASRRRTRRGAPHGPSQHGPSQPCDLLRRCYRELQGRARGRGAKGSAWDELVGSYGGLLHYVARRVLRRYHIIEGRLQAEDIVQEVYLRLLAADGRRLRAFRGDRQPQTVVYLKRFTERVAYGLVRGLLAEKRAKGTRAQNFGVWLRSLKAEPQCARERLLDRERLRELLRGCVEVTHQPNRRRDLKILYLAYGEGWDSASIATAVPGSLRPVGVDTALHRMRVRLARRGIHLGRRVTATRPMRRRQLRLPRQRPSAAA